MLRIKTCGFFIAAILILPQACFSENDTPEDLYTLVITKKEQLFLGVYSSPQGKSIQPNYQSPIEELSSLPLDLQSRSLRSGIQADFSIRGSTAEQVLVMLNGQRVNDPQTAHYDCDIPFTKADIQKVEVIPGAGSSLFGPDAIAGAVNFSLEQPKERKMILESGMGSFRDGYGLFSFTEKFKNLGLRYSVEEAQSKGFRYDTDYRKFTTSLSTSLELPGISWENDFGYQDKDYGAYDFYTPGLGYPSRESVQTYLFNSGLSLKQEGLLVKPNFLWRRHYDKFALDRTQLRSKSINQHRTDMFTPSIYLQKQVGQLGKLGLGAEWGQERITSTNLGRHTRDHTSVFLDDSKEFGPRWKAGFSLRLDDFSDFGKVYTGSTNLKFQLSEPVSFNFGVARSMRVPSFTELYYSDPYTLGNDSLSAEKTWNYQAGIEYERDGDIYNFVFFLRREKDMIDWVKSSPDQLWQAKNFTEDDVLGVQYFMRKKLNHTFSLDANYTYANKSMDTQGYLYKYGPNYARHLVNTVLNIKLPFGTQEVGLSYKKKPGRRGWLLANAGLNYNLTKNSRMFLNCENMLNVEYQDIEGIPQPGRYFEAGLRLEW
ncbi:MAG: TonB-dependent receptor [Candidatus Omnitrophota bacterium]